MTTLTDKYLFYVTILQAIICAIGILLNWPIIYITIKYKSLHRTYGYYLVICVILDMLFEFASALPMVLVAMQIYIPLLTCFYVQWYGSFSNIVVMALNLIIGIDRLCAVLFPFYFTKFEKKYAGRTVLFTTFIACLYGFFLVQYMFRYALANPNKLVYCQITDIVQGDAQVIGYYVTFILNGLILFIYVLIWILIKLLKNQDMIAIRIFKTLFILMSTILCLWLAQSLIVSVILPQLGLNADTQYLVVRLCSQTVRVASALNTPILYFCNSEYRTILRIEFNRIFQWCKNGNPNIATGPNQLIPVSNTWPINVVRPSNPAFSSALMRQIQV